MPMSKRERLAPTSNRLGITAEIERLPQKRRLFVLNYHRIGAPEDTVYDPGAFFATAEDLALHLENPKNCLEIITLLDELCISCLAVVGPQR